MDLVKMMRQAQEMQAKLSAAQDELGALEVTGQAGGGMVTVTMTAKGALKRISVDESLMKPEEKEILEDLFVTAHADARRKGEQLVEERMRALTAGLPLPPGFKLPF